MDASAIYDVITSTLRPSLASFRDIFYFQLIANGTFSMPDHLHGPQSLNYWVTQLSSLVPKEEKVVDKEERSKTKTAQNINAWTVAVAGLMMMTIMLVMMSTMKEDLWCGWEILSAGLIL